jgi:hypothetical protein
MTMSLIFWVMMLFFLLSLLGSSFFPGLGHYAPVISSAFIFGLFLLLGWKVFGRPISDA